MLEVLARHWKELRRRSKDCSEDDVVSDTEMGNVGGCELGMCKKVSWEEVEEFLKCLRRGKVPGPDGILNEMVMYGGGRLVEVMLQVMNLVLWSESCPADWKRSLLVPLYKNGDNEEVGNYRRIALGYSVARVFMRVMAMRLGRFTEDRILTEAQGGFRSHRRYSDQWLVLRCVCELRKKEKKTTHLAFLDVSKAYDRVWREGLWYKMWHYGVELLRCVKGCIVE